MKIFTFLAVLFGTASLHAVAAAPAPIVIKFSHVVAPETAKGQAAEMFKKLAEQLTRGRVRVELYPNSSLYKDADEMAALLKGDVQMLAPSLAKFSGLGVPEFEVFDVPYLFPDRGALYRVIDGKIGRDLLKRLEPKGVVGLAYWDNGFKQMSSNKPLYTPADLKGLTMRVQNSQVIAAQMRTIGTTPKALNLADTLQGIKSGAVNGTENSPSNLYSQKIHLVQENLTVSNHGYLGYAVIANKKFWDSLPNDIRNSLNNALAESTAYEKSYAKYDNDRALQAIGQTGKTEVYVLSSDEEGVWQRAMASVPKQVEARIGKTLLEQVTAEAQR